MTVNKASDTLKKKIKEFEGLRLKAYRCPSGVWTCGYGHTKYVRSSTSCTQAGADRWLDDDLAPIEAFLSAIRQIDTQGKFDACADFCFNLGLGAFRDSTLLKKIQAGATATAIQTEFAKWVYAGGRRLDGLVKRRAWEARRYAE